MAATYDPTLPTDRDWVRFLIGDTNVTPATDALFTDEEIDAVLTEQSNKYLAAARLLSNLSARWAGAGRGVMSKRVDELSARWGVSGDTASALASRIAELRSLGMPPPRVFKSL
jgi:hypothetical protein